MVFVSLCCVGMKKKRLTHMRPGELCKAGKNVVKSELLVMALLVRSFVAGDTARLRAICHQTVGERPFLPYVDDPCFASAFYLDPYLQLEAESCFVAEYEGSIVGYLVGTCDLKRFHDGLVGYFRRHLPEYLLAHFKGMIHGVYSHALSHRLLAKIYVRIIFGRFQDASSIGRVIDLHHYPAHCHLQVAQEARDKRVGLALMLKFHEYLKARHISGQHSSLVEEVGREGYSRMLLAMRFRAVQEGIFTRQERPTLIHAGTWRELILVRDI